jgi:hypothetical protein
MNAENLFWAEWKETLNRLGIKNWIASVLEFSGPFSILGAQFLFIGSPFLDGIFPQRQLDALSQVLEEPTQTQAFVNYLRESQ